MSLVLRVLPADVVNKFEAAIKRGTETPQFKAAIERVYVSPIYYYGSQDYSQHLKDFWTKNEKLFKDVGIIKAPATQPYILKPIMEVLCFFTYDIKTTSTTMSILRPLMN